MQKQKPLKIGDMVGLKGCFTEEYFVRGLSLRQIGKELGLPLHILADGAYVAFAVELPRYPDFELGGWAKYSTDKFIDYRKGKMDWSELKFEETYAGIRVPISIDEAKKAWLSNMRNEKLIKVLPQIKDPNAEYPVGGLASQIIIRNEVRCQIVKFLKLNDIFRSVWT